MNSRRRRNVCCGTFMCCGRPKECVIHSVLMGISTAIFGTSMILASCMTYNSSMDRIVLVLIITSCLLYLSSFVSNIYQIYLNKSIKVLLREDRNYEDLNMATWISSQNSTLSARIPESVGTFNSRQTASSTPPPPYEVQMLELSRRLKPGANRTNDSLSRETEITNEARRIVRRMYEEMSRIEHSNRNEQSMEESPVNDRSVSQMTQSPRRERSVKKAQRTKNKQSIPLMDLPTYNEQSMQQRTQSPRNERYDQQRAQKASNERSVQQMLPSTSNEQSMQQRTQPSRNERSFQLMVRPTSREQSMQMQPRTQSPLSEQSIQQMVQLSRSEQSVQQAVQLSGSSKQHEKIIPKVSHPNRVIDLHETTVKNVYPYELSQKNICKNSIMQQTCAPSAFPNPLDLQSLVVGSEEGATAIARPSPQRDDLQVAHKRKLSSLSKGSMTRPKVKGRATNSSVDDNDAETNMYEIIEVSNNNPSTSSSGVAYDSLRYDTIKSELGDPSEQASSTCSTVSEPTTEERLRKFRNPGVKVRRQLSEPSTRNFRLLGQSPEIILDAIGTGMDMSPNEWLSAWKLANKGVSPAKRAELLGVRLYDSLSNDDV